jgi:hypothetical protein
MNWIKTVMIKMTWPKIKKILLSYVADEIYQNIIVEKINQKLDIPNIPEETEQIILNQVYDASQLGLTEFIQNIDIEDLIKKIQIGKK